jgi:hypothetical protein
MRRILKFAFAAATLQRDRCDRLVAGEPFDLCQDTSGEALGQLLPNVYHAVLARIKDRPVAGSMTAIAAGAS